MAKSDFILGRRHNRLAFQQGRTFVASAYRRSISASRAHDLREDGHSWARAMRYSYAGPVRYADGVLESRNYAPDRTPSVGYRIRVIPRKQP